MAFLRSSIERAKILIENSPNKLSLITSYSTKTVVDSAVEIRSNVSKTVHLAAKIADESKTSGS
jgi:hypothetical protein